MKKTLLLITGILLSTLLLANEGPSDWPTFSPADTTKLTAADWQAEGCSINLSEGFVKTRT